MNIMAESSTSMFPSSLQDVMGIIDTPLSDISDENRQELRQNVQELMDIDRIQSGFAAANATRDKNESSVGKTVKVLMKFAGQKLLQVGKKIPQTKVICIVIGAVVAHVFGKDKNIVTQVAKQLKSILDERFMSRCQATSHRFNNCMRYIAGLPSPDNLSATERKMYLDRLASDNPIYTGLNEISILSLDIQKLMDAKDTPDMTVLMSKVQMYCCLTTFRELFLLLRFSIETTYGIDTQSIINVLEGQRDDDRSLLKFLYKPSRYTLHIFLKYKPNEWQIVDEFLRRRRLVTNLHGFDNRVFQLCSVPYPDSPLSCHDLFIFTCTRCHTGTEGELTLFRLRVTQGDVVSLHPLSRPNCYIYNRDWVRMNTDPARGSREWQVVEIEPETRGDNSYFMFRLGSQGNYCMYVDFTRRVFVKKHTKGDRNCFWRLTDRNENSA